MTSTKPDKKKLVKLVKKGSWFVQGFNGLPLYLHNVASNTGWMTKEISGATYSHFFLRVHESRAHWYYDELDMAKVGEGYYKRVRSVAELRRFENKHRELYAQAYKNTGPISPPALPHLSLKGLAKLAENLVRELTLSVGLAHAQEGISFVSEMKLKQILDSRSRNTHENYQLLASPVELSFLSQAQILLYSIRKAKGNSKLKLVKKFLTDFHWLDNSYVRGKKLTEEEVLQKAKSQKYAPSGSGLNQIKLRKEKLIKVLSLSSEEIFVLRTIEICTKWQDNRKKYIMQTIGRFEPVIEELARRLYTTSEALKYITPLEVNYKNLSSKKFLASLSARYPQSEYYTNSTGIFSYPGKDHAFIQKAVGKENSSVVTELRGSIASKGLVRGRVRICRTIHDIAKVQKGEILVAYMTRPEFLPAMQKAAGFVTNEGGITSHAAIISREMKKPCIIGTKIATKVLHDGDMVEVDANKGTVKKL